MAQIRIALAQVNPTVGAFEENAVRLAGFAERALQEGAQVVVFPEMSLCGYPPEDLILKPHFVERAAEHLEGLAERLPPDLICLVGTTDRGPVKPFNAAAVVCGGKVAAHYHKRHLPNYGVFDEQRIFAPGERALCVHNRGVRLGLHICEDSWFPEAPHVAGLRTLGLSALLNLSASPYHHGKMGQRVKTLQATARAAGLPLVYCNLVGGQDELVFDGGSLVLDADGRVLARAKRFEEDLLLVDLPVREELLRPEAAPLEEPDWIFVAGEVSPPESCLLETRLEADLCPLEEVYRALCLGLRDYADKNGFRDVLIAISGGIDSALVAALAVDALGADRVTGITLPSRFNASETLSDAHALAASLGFAMSELPIQDLFTRYLDLLQPLWPGRAPDVTEENLQARIRGNIVMALSNKFGRLVLATGNKSELATGYCTLYGDMCGGYALIKDVPKTLVFQLCEWVNRRDGRERIPVSIITRPPSAELRDNQKDSDSLPPYAELDAVLERYVERDMPLSAIVADGFEPELVQRVIRLVDFNEYKRRQAPPGVKITPKAFGRDRRMPITNRYRSTWKPPPATPGAPV